jgi:hypothetical protein
MIDPDQFFATRRSTEAAPAQRSEWRLRITRERLTSGCVLFRLPPAEELRNIGTLKPTVARR